MNVMKITRLHNECLKKLHHSNNNNNKNSIKTIIRITTTIIIIINMFHYYLYLYYIELHIYHIKNLFIRFFILVHWKISFVHRDHERIFPYFIATVIAKYVHLQV